MSGPAESVYDVIVPGTGPVGQTVAERAGAFPRNGTRFDDAEWGMLPSAELNRGWPAGMSLREPG